MRRRAPSFNGIPRDIDRSARTAVTCSFCSFCLVQFRELGLPLHVLGELRDLLVGHIDRLFGTRIDALAHLVVLADEDILP